MNAYILTEYPKNKKNDYTNGRGENQLSESLLVTKARYMCILLFTYPEFVTLQSLLGERQFFYICKTSATVYWQRRERKGNTKLHTRGK